MMEHSTIVSLPMNKSLFLPANISVSELKCCFQKVHNRAISPVVKENFDRCLRLITLAMNYDVKKIELTNSKNSLIFCLIFICESDLNNFNKALSSNKI